MKVIIFPNDNGGASVLYPTPEYQDNLEFLAEKDVPDGRPWRIIDASELPEADSNMRLLWSDTGPVSAAPQVRAVPEEVSRFQAKAALALAGKLTQADAAVQASGDIILQLAWSEAGTFKRNSPGIALLAPLIGLDDAGLDDLFRTAAGIVA